MRGWWGDVTARAAGLSTHLIEGPGLEVLVSTDLAGLAEELRRRGGALPPAREATPGQIDAAIRSAAAARLELLARWLGGRARAAAVVYEEEERRSVRALLRGAAGGAPPAIRLAGLLPSPALPARLLDALARLDTPAEVARELAARRHPYGEALAEVTADDRADLFELEAALDRRFAARVTKAARRAGRHLRAYAARSVDLLNAWTALFADALSGEVDPGTLFLTGGRALPLRRFRAVAALAPGGRPRALAEAFGPGPVAEAFVAGPAEPSRLEARLLSARIAEERRVARLDPGGPAPFLAFALRLRAEAANLGRIAWGIALAAPPEVIREELVAAAPAGVDR